MNPHELELLHMTTALRTQMMDTLTDADLNFSLPNNPPLGELCRAIGNVERAYIDSFNSLKVDWGKRTNEAGLEKSVEKLKAWYKALDEEFDTVLNSIPDADFQSKFIDRGGDFQIPMGGQFHAYREALLIFCGNSKPYLLALNKPISEQWKGWIG